ncbi:Peptidase, M28 family [Candidatus Promineifilum breve]|uniref:Peptidase, M28 family n=1 Tax=Candidatus Promineifilum breve TaxID=1806508 RepID=A0A160T4H4_9CHLR|nr:M28 family peptidase [Candidatus Promineifilum breve]CUS05181.2 Peptidase, M28 family [Candidatus Promineifilum breve]
MSQPTTAGVAGHLAALTRWPDGRPVGSAANHAAEAYIAGVLSNAGYDVERQHFDCIDWRLEGVELRLADRLLPARANPFSPPCDVSAPGHAVGSLSELEAANLEGHVALLHGELTAEPLFPKNYPFFTVEEHRRVIELLEAKRPAVVITVSPLTGAPAPIIEDGDFTLPSVTVSGDVGEALLAAAGAPITVLVHSSARPGYGANVIGRRVAPSREKLIISAHFDTKPGTPGALDNAAGVACILALAERLAAAPPAINLEFVAFNGEDHYAAPGEVAYLAGCVGDLGRVALVVNVDGVGLRHQPVTVAFFNCPAEWVEATRAIMGARPGLAEAEPWPQGDHSLFAMQGIPCIALTSGGIFDIVDSVIHTAGDTPAGVDPVRIAAAADFLGELLSQIEPPQPISAGRTG